MKYNILIRVNEVSVKDENIQTKKGDVMRIYSQQVLAIPEFNQRDVCIPIQVDLAPDSEPLAEGYYGLCQNLKVSPYGKLELDAFGQVEVFSLGQDVSELSYEQFLFKLKELRAQKKQCKSVSSKRNVIAAAPAQIQQHETAIPNNGNYSYFRQ